MRKSRWRIAEDRRLTEGKKKEEEGTEAQEKKEEEEVEESMSIPIVEGRRKAESC